MVNDFQKTEIGVILGYIAALNNQGRWKLFEQLQIHWCQGCGVENREGYRCQCQNDD